MFRFHIVAVAAALCVTSSIAPAQQQPCAGMQERSLKALSAQQIDDLRAGRGAGLALAAELNDYPGPVHVLELAEQLGLSAEQRSRTRALHEAMRREAVSLGEQLIREEAALDGAFASRTITRDSLDQQTAMIGGIQASLRAAHLRYHLAQAEILTPVQVRRYAELRGYAGRTGHGDGDGHQHQHR